jgi:hypothetical protein
LELRSSEIDCPLFRTEWRKIKCRATKGEFPRKAADEASRRWGSPGHYHSSAVYVARAAHPPRPLRQEPATCRTVRGCCLLRRKSPTSAWRPFTFSTRKMLSAQASNSLRAMDAVAAADAEVAGGAADTAVRHAAAGMAVEVAAVEVVPVAAVVVAAAAVAVACGSPASGFARAALTPISGWQYANEHLQFRERERECAGGATPGTSA